MFNNFGERFAYQTQGGGWGGWTPPWLQDDRSEERHHHGHHHHHHHHEPQHGGPGGWGGPRFMQRGRGPFGGHGPFGRGPFGPGPQGPQGPFGEGQRFFGRGDVKFALLELLRERPMHGYEMMKALEEKSGGFYTPSAGTIYPTLQMLEDRNLVTSNEADGKKVYSITDAGRAFLEQQQKESGSFEGPAWARGFGPKGPKGRRGFRNAPEMQALGTEAREVARLFAIATRSSFNNPEQATRLRTIIESARKDLSDLIYGTGTSTGTGPATPPENTGTPDVEQA